MARAVELDALTPAGPRFRVWCTTLRRYILSDVKSDQVREFYQEVVRSRAAQAAEADMEEALSQGVLPKRTSSPAGGH